MGWISKASANQQTGPEVILVGQSLGILLTAPPSCVPHACILKRSADLEESENLQSSLDGTVLRLEASQSLKGVQLDNPISMCNSLFQPVSLSPPKVGQIDLFVKIIEGRPLLIVLPNVGKRQIDAGNRPWQLDL